MAGKSTIEVRYIYIWCGTSCKWLVCSDLASLIRFFSSIVDKDVASSSLANASSIGGNKKAVEFSKNPFVAVDFKMFLLSKNLWGGNLVGNVSNFGVFFLHFQQTTIYLKALLFWVLQFGARVICQIMSYCNLVPSFMTQKIMGMKKILQHINRFFFTTPTPPKKSTSMNPPQKMACWRRNSCANGSCFCGFFPNFRATKLGNVTVKLSDSLEISLRFSSLGSSPSGGNFR